MCSMRAILRHHCVPTGHNSCRDNTSQIDIQYLSHPHRDRLRNQRKHRTHKVRVADRNQDPLQGEGFQKLVGWLFAIEAEGSPDATISQKSGHCLCLVYKVAEKEGLPSTSEW